MQAPTARARRDGRPFRRRTFLEIETLVGPAGPELFLLEELPKWQLEL